MWNKRVTLNSVKLVMVHMVVDVKSLFYTDAQTLILFA